VSARDADTPHIERRPAPISLSPNLALTDRELRYVAAPNRMRPGNRMRLLIDGDITFEAMLAEIGGARRSIHLETYIFADDSVGAAFAKALGERARAGVAVRLLYDGLGSFNLPDLFVARLRQAGVQTACYKPLRWRHRRRWSRRDHRKILVVDSRIGFLGGINVSSEHLSRDAGGDGWRDTHVAVQGPVVAELEAMFHDTWHAAGGAPYGPPVRAADESVAVPASQYALVVRSDRGNRTAIRRHYLHAIEAARDRIAIANAYFVPDPGIRRALCAAARRGVTVDVVVPAQSDLRWVQYGSEYTYGPLLDAGVRIYLWPETHMHAKTACIDGVWSAIGSYNLDYISLFNNLEVLLVTVGDVVGAAMRAMFEADLSQCDPLTAAQYANRPWWRRVASWLAYRFRRWL
jgi:cardiolipin synthase